MIDLKTLLTRGLLIVAALVGVSAAVHAYQLGAHGWGALALVAGVGVGILLTTVLRRQT